MDNKDTLNPIIPPTPAKKNKPIKPHIAAGIISAAILTVGISLVQLQNSTDNRSKASFPATSFCQANPCGDGFSCTSLGGGRCYISNPASVTANTEYSQIINAIEDLLESCNGGKEGSVSSRTCSEDTQTSLTVLQGKIEEIETIVDFQVSLTEELYYTAEDMANECLNNSDSCTILDRSNANIILTDIEEAVSGCDQSTLVCQRLKMIFPENLGEIPDQGGFKLSPVTTNGDEE